MSVGKRKEIENKNEVIYNYLNEMPEGVNIDIEEEKREFFEKIEKRRIKTYNFRILKYAAIGLLLVSTGYFLTKDDIIPVQEVVVENNIPIPTDKAILTLDDGTNVALEKGQQYENEAVSSDGEKIVYKTADRPVEKIAFNYLTIPRGGQFFIELEDGTNVWLNADSKLKYPTKFIDGQPREVELVYGEAIFDVSHSTEHNGDRFKLFSQGQEIEVLGTEFNVKSYKDDQIIQTTLIEGKVQIEVNEFKDELNPSQQFTFNKIQNSTTKAVVNVSNVISWRNGSFYFEDKTLKEASDLMERWYDIDIEIQNPEIEQIKLTGTVSKNQNIEYILITLKNIKNIKYEIKEDKIYLK